MYFRQIFDTDSHAFTYLLADELSSRAVVIDPMLSQATMILALLAERGLLLDAVLRTHLHPSDRYACGDLCQHTGARFIIGAGGDSQIKGERVTDGDRIVFGGETILVIATPGHTPESICYLWRDRLFSGETLLIQEIGSCVDDFACGQLYDSITRKLFVLPDEILVFPAFDMLGRTVSTIREERDRNRAFAVSSREAFIANTRRHLRRKSAIDRCPLVSHRDGTW